MKNDRQYDQLRERSWRGPLTAAEEAQLRAWLAKHPDAQADWEVEVALNDALRGLPDIPLPSNFTALAVAAAQREVQVSAPRTNPLLRWWRGRRRWVRRMALAVVVIAAGSLSYHHVQDINQSRKWVRPLELVSGVGSVPNAEILQNFEAIRALDRASADEDLLKLLQ